MYLHEMSNTALNLSTVIKRSSFIITDAIFIFVSIRAVLGQPQCGMGFHILSSFSKLLVPLENSGLWQSISTVGFFNQLKCINDQLTICSLYKSAEAIFFNWKPIVIPIWHFHSLFLIILHCSFLASCCIGYFFQHIEPVWVIFKLPLYKGHSRNNDTYIFLAFW